MPLPARIFGAPRPCCAPVSVLAGGGVAAEAARSVVCIDCEAADGNVRTESGVLVGARGHVLTAAHVVPRGGRCGVSPGVADPRNSEPLIHLPESRPDNHDAALPRFARRAPRPCLKVRPLDAEMPRATPVVAGGTDGMHGYGPMVRPRIMASSRITRDGRLGTDALALRGMRGGPVLSEDRKRLAGSVSGAESGPGGAPARNGMPPIKKDDDRGPRHDGKRGSRP